MTENFGTKLLAWRQRDGLTQSEAAKKLGVSRNYVGMLEQGREPSDALLKLFELLEKEGRDNRLIDEPSLYKTRSVKPEMMPVVWIPVVSWAHAGTAMSYEEIPKDWQDQIPCTCKSPDAFSVKIEGDSMEPRLVSGDVVVLMPHEEPRNGCLVVAKLSDDGVLIRRYTKLDDDRIRLTAYNPVYPPQEFTARNFHWIYPVHSTVRREWN